MRNSVIFSTGSYLPESVVPNEELAQFPSSSLKLIAQKTGVLSRRIAPEDQCTSDLAIKAARSCLEKVDFPAESVQGIVLSTSSPDRIQPATATGFNMNWEQPTLLPSTSIRFAPGALSEFVWPMP